MIHRNDFARAIPQNVSINRAIIRPSRFLIKASFIVTSIHSIHCSHSLNFQDEHVPFNHNALAEITPACPKFTEFIVNCFFFGVECLPVAASWFTVIIVCLKQYSPCCVSKLLTVIVKVFVSFFIFIVLVCFGLMPDASRRRAV